MNEKRGDFLERKLILSDTVQSNFATVKGILCGKVYSRRSFMLAIFLLITVPVITFIHKIFNVLLVFDIQGVI